jgi:hypothetical protein
VLLFRFLESSTPGRELLRRFYDFYGLAHWKQYLEAVTPYIIIWADRKNPSSTDLVLDNNDKFDKNVFFLKRHAFSTYVKVDDVDYLDLRERPLYEISENTFRIIHPLFLMDKIYKGIFFLLSQLGRRVFIVGKQAALDPAVPLNKPESRVFLEGWQTCVQPAVQDGFRSWYTRNFSEDVCFREVISYAVPDFDARFFDPELKGIAVGPPIAI